MIRVLIRATIARGWLQEKKGRLRGTRCELYLSKAQAPLFNFL